MLAGVVCSMGVQGECYLLYVSAVFVTLGAGVLLHGLQCVYVCLYLVGVGGSSVCLYALVGVPA